MREINPPRRVVCRWESAIVSHFPPITSGQMTRDISRPAVYLPVRLPALVNLGSRATPVHVRRSGNDGCLSKRATYDTEKTSESAQGNVRPAPRMGRSLSPDNEETMGNGFVLSGGRARNRI